MPWQCLLATAVLGVLALTFEGPPPTHIGMPAILALTYNGVIGTALGFWAMTVVNRRVPAATAALGVLATPVCGIGLAAVFLGEGLDPVLLFSALVNHDQRPRRRQKAGLVRMTSARERVGATVLFVSHDVAEAVFLADRVAITTHRRDGQAFAFRLMKSKLFRTDVR